MRVFDKVDFDEWEEIADKCDYATFFHTPAWYKVFLQTTPGSEITTKKFLWKDGKSAIFPLLQTRSIRGLFRTYQSSPVGCYGGWISKDELLAEQVVEMTQWIRRHFKNLVWRLNPFTNNSNEVARLFPTRGDSTQILYLSRFQNEDSLLKNYKYSVRKQVRKGQKAGFKITRASTWDDWKKYFQIYQMALARWGDKATSKYSLKFFQTIFDLHSTSVKLWLVLSEDQIVGGNLNFYQGKHCVEWHAALDSNFFKYGVRNFFVHNIILDALKRGYKIYDFNPSGGHEGVKAFKKSFGAEDLPCPVVNAETTHSRLAKRIRPLVKMSKIVYFSELIKHFPYRFLSYTENRCIRFIKLNPVYPPLFIIGAPRSGTTALFLLITNSYRVSYWPNISKYHPQAAFCYALLGSMVGRYVPTFENTYGIVNQAMAPSDGWDILHRWFDRGYQAKLPHKDFYSLKTLIRLFEKLLKGPFCVRNNVNSLRIAHLKKIFPNALFLAITRDFRQAAFSLQKAYRVHGTQGTDWWSAGPPDYEMESFENDLEKAIFQILGVEAIMKQELQFVHPDNRLSITYRRLCDNPNEVREWLEKAYKKKGLELQKRQFFEATPTYLIKSGRAGKKSAEREKEIKTYFCRFLKGEHLKSKRVLSDEVRELVKSENLRQE